MLLLSACLQLRAYYLFDDSDSESRRQGLIRAYATAVSLISEIERADVNHDFVRYLQHPLMRVADVAAVLIMKVVHSTYAQHVDVQSGKRVFNVFLSMSRQCCVEDNDLMGRMRKILAQLWNVHRSLSLQREEPPALNRKSRGFFSVVHDALWLWRDNFGGQPGNGAPALPPSILSPAKAPTHTSFTDDDLSPSVPSSTTTLRAHPRALSTAQQPEQMALPDQSAIAQESGGPGYLPDTFDISLDEENWMWNVGFPSLGTMDFVDMYPTTNAGLPPEYHM